MTSCPACSCALPDALSFPACGSALVESATPTKRQIAAAPTHEAGSPAYNPDYQAPRIESSDTTGEGRFIAGAMLAGRYRIVTEPPDELKGQLPSPEQIARLLEGIE